jgi:hypothetical protein
MAMKKSFSKFPAPFIALALGLAPLGATAWDHDDDDNEIEWDEAELFFELNNTDGDLGIHALIDGEAWKKLEIEDKHEREMLDVTVKGRLRRQGLTEIFFESAEPTFDELSPWRFFKRFPAGKYEIEGETLDGEELEAEVELTHVMPAPPSGIMLNGTSDPDSNTSVKCDDRDEVAEVDASHDGTVTISWEQVDTHHPTLGSDGDVEIHNYEVVVEVEAVDGDDEYEAVYSVRLPPWITSMTVPAEFIGLGDEFKYEILAREGSFNQTAVESCFEVNGD